MVKLKIFSIGKTKEPWLKLAIEEYTTRLRPILSIEWHLPKTDEQLVQLLTKEKTYYALDPSGKSFTSEEFSHWLFSEIDHGGSRMNLVIGGADGLPPSIRESAHLLISLSPLTFTHQITRLVLLEQIYRASEITKGSRYHK
ncbi:MAG: Ribosomal RNA large subunit methyltransferase H [Chlamydiae bacterium]|nr:Ribosomal RNA large subunit methyltransferase H [Chlamydiota bacterium]